MVSSTIRRLVVALTCAALAVSVLGAAPANAKPKKTKAQVSWGATTWAAGSAGYAITGHVSGKKRRVVFQTRIGSGWRKIDKTKTDKDGNFTLASTWDWYGNHQVRILVPGTKKFRPKRKKASVTVDPGYAPAGDPSHFRRVKSRGRVIRWNPCQTITYKVNTKRVGDSVIPIVQESFNRITLATGITFKYRGKTNYMPFKKNRRNPKRAGEITVAWSGTDQFKSLTEPLARGGATWGFYRRVRGKPTFGAVSGGVIVDTAKMNLMPVAMDLPGQSTLGQTLIHEVGHVLGLGHAPKSDGQAQIMYPQAGSYTWPDGYQRALYQAGDLAGLRKVGLQAGCF